MASSGRGPEPSRADSPRRSHREEPGGSGGWERRRVHRGVSGRSTRRPYGRPGQRLPASSVGIPDDRFGETPAVLAVPRQGASVSAGEILTHCRSSVSTFKRPSAATIVDSLPITGIGKLVKTPLREAIERGEIELEYAH